MKKIRIPKDYFKRPLEALQYMEKSLERIKFELNSETGYRSVIKGGVYVGSGTLILDPSVIEGPAYISENCVIGPFAHIKPKTYIGKGCKIGYSQVKNSIIMDETAVPHFNYIGDSVIGKRCNFGAGAKTANLRFDEKNVRIGDGPKRVDSGRKKLGAIVGDDVKFGINVSIMPGVRVGHGCIIGAGVLLDRDLEDNTFYGIRSGKNIAEKLY